MSVLPFYHSNRFSALLVLTFYHFLRPCRFSHFSIFTNFPNIGSLVTLPLLMLLPLWACRNSHPYIPHFAPTTLTVTLSDIPTWRIIWIIITLHSLPILPCPLPYRIGAYRNPTYYIYHILFYRRSSGGASNRPDNHLAAWGLALEPKDKSAL